KLIEESMKGSRWSSAAAVMVVVSFAAALPAHAGSDVVYGGVANGAGGPLSPPHSADPGAAPRGAAPSPHPPEFPSPRMYCCVNLGEALAIEAAQRRHFGDATKPSDEALSLAGKVKLPVNDGLSLTGKMGLQYSGANGSVGGPEAAPVYGLGVAYEVSQKLEL